MFLMLMGIYILHNLFYQQKAFEMQMVCLSNIFTQHLIKEINKNVHCMDMQLVSR